MPPESLPLRDIHLPAAPGWWPPAPGWWLLLALALLVLLLVLYWRRRRRGVRRLQTLMAARQALESIEARHAQEGDDEALARALSALLRQTCLGLYPRRRAASLTGPRWLALLDAPLAEPGFSQGPGRVLAAAPYQRQARMDSEALLALVHEWLDALARSPGEHDDAAA